jgi:branched-chain amino acid transport system permease protein
MSTEEGDRRAADDAIGGRPLRLVTLDGKRHLHVMKGMNLTGQQSLMGLFALIFVFAVPDLARGIDFLSRSIIQKGLVFGMAALGLNIILRHTRMVSFGHAAFFGTSAYTIAVLAAKFDIAHMSVLLLSGVILAGLMATVLGFLALRHTGIYFALLTLAFGQLLYAIALGTQYLNFSDGLPVRPGDANQVLIAGLALESDIYDPIVYYISMIVIIASILVMWRIVRSPFGRALDAIGQDRTRAEFIGIPVQKYVWIAFVISGVYGGFAGGLYAMMQQHVRPGPTLFFQTSGDILLMAIMGGFQTLMGPIIGGVIVIHLVDLGRHYTEYFNMLTGLVLLTVVYFFPEGVVGSLRKGGNVRNRLGEFRRNPSIVGQWARSAVSAVGNALQRSVQNIKEILFGVK